MENIFVITWIASGIIGSGFMFANIRHDFPDLNVRDDLGYAIVFSLFGYVTLVVGFLSSGFGQYGWWIWFKKSKQNR